MPDLSELRREVEDLALQLVMADAGERPGGAPEEALATLERISRIAAREHAGEAVAAASALREALRAGGGVDEGMARLEATLNAPAGAAPPPPPPSSLSQDPELVRDFIMESREHLAAIETQVLALERDPELAEALNAVFRGNRPRPGPQRPAPHDARRYRRGARSRRRPAPPLERRGSGHERRAVFAGAAQ
jgi:two-component system chemotaxis sensor kinase CheA